MERFDIAYITAIEQMTFETETNDWNVMMDLLMMEDETPEPDMIYEQEAPSLIRTGRKELDDKTALLAAAQFVETAAYNLAGQIDSGKVARLILISHELSTLSEALQSNDDED